MKYILILILMFVGMSSCKKFLAIDPPKTELSGSLIFDSDVSATSALVGIYTQMENEGFVYDLVLNTGLSGDEFLNYANSVESNDLANNNLTAENGYVQSIWTDCYSFIYQANAILESIERSSSISRDVKDRIAGEAKFIRAYCNFTLLNLYGAIPLVKTTDYALNSSLPRAALTEVYAFIKSDLESSIQLLGVDYVGANNLPTTEKVRPNKWTATALLAKVHLYLGEWEQAINASNLILSANNYTLAPDLNDVFLKNSQEAIWQLMCTAPMRNTYLGFLLILQGVPGSVTLRPEFVESFGENDKRREQWIGELSIGSNSYYFPYKYKMGQNTTSVTEYTMMFRLSEIYLIRAEARARQNQLEEALQDLNLIRVRAGLTMLEPNDADELIKSIQEERNFELFTESGDRWFNLKRSGTAAEVISSIKEINWDATDELYPIPQSEILRNTNLTQNPGY